MTLGVTASKEPWSRMLISKGNTTLLHLTITVISLYRAGIYNTDYEEFVPDMYQWPDIAYPEDNKPKH